MIGALSRVVVYVEAFSFPQIYRRLICWRGLAMWVSTLLAKIVTRKTELLDRVEDRRLLPGRVGFCVLPPVVALAFKSPATPETTLLLLAASVAVWLGRLSFESAPVDLEPNHGLGRSLREDAAGGEPVRMHRVASDDQCAATARMRGSRGQSMSFSKVKKGP